MRTIALILIAAMVIMFGVPAHAGDAVQKLGRGTANIVTCSLELPRTMGQTTEEKGPFAGFTWGVFQGVFNVAKRAAAGVYEVATFPLPLPKDYAPVLKEPEFFLQPGERGRL